MSRPSRHQDEEQPRNRPPPDHHQSSGGEYPGERLAAIVDSLDVIIWEFDATDLSTTYVSPQIESMLGFSVEEAYQRPTLWHEILHPDDAERVIQFCRDHTRKGCSHQLEYRVLTVDAEVRWVRDIASYVPCEGEHDRLRCVFSDITERQEALCRLERSRERLAAAQRIAHVGDWQWDLDTDEVLWSDECYRIFGMAPQSMELTFDDVLSFMPEQSVEALAATTLRVLEQKKNYAMDQYLVLPNGEPRIIHFESEVLRDDVGEPYLMRGTAQDITKLRRAEALHRRLGRILEHSSTEVLMFDADSHQITRANRAARENLEYPLAKLEQMTILDVLEPTSRDRFDKRLCQIREGGRDVVRFDSWAKRPDGSSYPVSVQLLYSGLDLHPVYVAIIEDRSRREEVERLKDAFLGLVSHELRTPLTPLNGVLEVMKLEVDPDQQPRLSRMVDLAQSNSRRLLEVVNNLLDLRRLTGDNGVELELEPRDLREVVDDALYESQAIFFSRNISYSFGRPPVPIRAEVDTRRILQVLSNLLSNAAKFSEPGGLIEIELDREDNWAVIRVRDYGAGIEEEFRPYVFDRFTQADPPMKRDYTGAGVGLALSKMLVEKHHGQIGFESVPGESTMFCVRLPLMA